MSNVSKVNAEVHVKGMNVPAANNASMVFVLIYATLLNAHLVNDVATVNASTRVK